MPMLLRVGMRMPMSVPMSIRMNLTLFMTMLGRMDLRWNGHGARGLTFLFVTV